jgi:hypothetical protein
VLIQYGADVSSRTYLDFDSVAHAADGVRVHSVAPCWVLLIRALRGVLSQASAQCTRRASKRSTRPFDTSPMTSPISITTLTSSRT